MPLRLEANPSRTTRWRAAPSRPGRSARAANGDRIERVIFRRSGGNAEATLIVAEDFAPARTAIADFAWPDAPFSRARMRAALGLGTAGLCCDDASALEAPREDFEAMPPLPPQAVEFQRHCASCHRTAERLPPNFLAGDAERVTASLAQCAPRIFVRLAMWQTPPTGRDKVPMPPPLASRGGAPWVQTAPDPAIVELQALWRVGSARRRAVHPMSQEMLVHGYENLRPCLPPDA